MEITEKTVYVYPEKARKKLRTAHDKEKNVYIYAMVGYGKSALVDHFLGKRKVIRLDAESSPVDDFEIPEKRLEKKQTVVIENLQFTDNLEIKEKIHQLVLREDLWVILLSRAECPSWLLDVRSHIPGINVTTERKIVNEAISVVPRKVQDMLNRGTIIDIGKDGASQYNYINDILYVAKGAEEADVIHEIGHMVENKMLDSNKVEKLKERFLKNVPFDSIIQKTYYDTDNNPIEIFLLRNPEFVSEYQGRLYVNDWSEIYDDNWDIKSDILQEFISEPFREYVKNTERLIEKYPEFYDLIKEAVE